MERKVQSLAGRSAIRVLVVDDEPTYCDLVQWGLGKFGIEVVCATSAVMAFVEIQSERAPIDLVLTDYRMPGMDGVEFIKRLNGSEPRFPIVIWSNFFSRTTLEEIEQLAQQMQIRSLEKSGDIRHLAELIRTEVAAWNVKKNARHLES